MAAVLSDNFDTPSTDKAWFDTNPLVKFSINTFLYAFSLLDTHHPIQVPH